MHKNKLLQFVSGKMLYLLAYTDGVRTPPLAHQPKVMVVDSNSCRCIEVTTQLLIV
jgi:hypothetical protein